MRVPCLSEQFKEKIGVYIVDGEVAGITKARVGNHIIGDRHNARLRGWLGRTVRATRVRVCVGAGTEALSCSRDISLKKMVKKFSKMSVCIHHTGGNALPTS